MNRNPVVRIPLTIAAACLLSACMLDSSAPPPALAQSQPTDPAIIAKTKAEREAVTKVYMVCLIQAARKLDDRKSDPATIAQAMLSACAVEFNKQVMTYWIAGTNLEQIDSAMRKDTLGQAIQIVLQNRNGQFKGVQ
jgi:hypothetical protein